MTKQEIEIKYGSKYVRDMSNMSKEDFELLIKRLNLGSNEKLKFNEVYMILTSMVAMRLMILNE